MRLAFQHSCTASIGVDGFRLLSGRYRSETDAWASYPPPCSRRVLQDASRTRATRFLTGVQKNHAEHRCITCAACLDAEWNMYLSKCKRASAVTAPAFTIRSSDFIGLFGQREKHGRWQVATPACVPRGEYTPHPSRGGLISSSFHPATGIFFHIQGERI